MAGDDENANNSSASFIRPPKPLEVNNSNMRLIWKNWKQQYDWFTIATAMDKKSSEVQIATFMSSIGQEAITIYNSFTLTEDQQKDIALIQKAFEDYFSPTVSTTFERFTFNKMEQLSDESFDEFLTRIRSQSKKCDFDKLHDSLLCDKIIVGIKSQAVRDKLLAGEKLTLEGAIKFCRTSEFALKQLQELQQKDESINALRKQKNSTSIQPKIELIEISSDEDDDVKLKTEFAGIYFFNLFCQFKAL